MTEGTEAAADILTGAVVAGTVEGRAGAVPPAGVDDTHGRCRNCGALLTGSYCAACGQPARIHRSLASLGHDILHFVFHFEGKLWRTLPELVIHPGRLTRRYVEGERAKFISPMALYLFMVFLMYAVFSLTGGAARNTDLAQIPGIPDDSGAAFEEIEGDLADLQEQLGDAQLSGERRAELVQEIADLETSRAVMEALAAGDLDRVEEIEREAAARRNEVAEDVAPDGDRSAFENRAREVVKEIQDNPALLTYKLKVNGYKYSWALVPLSIPFMWLLFFWRRDIRVYDHAVFVTYSISFMMLLLIVVSLLGMAGVSSGFLALGTQLIPPVHMYRQLRGAYALSRRGALLRLCFVLIAAAIVLIVFIALLLLIGVLG